MTISEQIKGNLSSFYNIRTSQSYLSNTWPFHTARCLWGSRTARRLLCSSSAPPGAPAGGFSPCWQPYTLSPTGETQTRDLIRHTMPFLFNFLKCCWCTDNSSQIAVYLTAQLGFLDHMRLRCGWKLYDVIGWEKNLRVSVNGGRFLFFFLNKSQNQISIKLMGLSLICFRERKKEPVACVHIL